MAESVFDRDVNGDGSTGVWWRHTFDIAGQNAANDWVDPADPRQIFQDSWPNLPDGITDGDSRSLGLLRCRQTARTWRPSISALSLITATLTDAVEPDIRIAIRLVSDDDFIALRLGMDTASPYTNMVVDFASDDLSGADIAARYETWLARAASSTAQITVALIDSTHSDFQSASYDFDDGAGSQAATAAPSIELDLSVSATATIGGGAQAATAAPSIEVDLSVSATATVEDPPPVSPQEATASPSIELDLSVSALATQQTPPRPRVELGRTGRRWWIDVELPDGRRVGPILTAASWSSTERMDQIGDFSFSLPATDPLADALVFRAIVRCYGIVGGRVTEIGSGMVYKRGRAGAAPGDIGRAVSGPGLAIQLSDVSVRDLQLGTEDAPISHEEAVDELADLAPAGWTLDRDAAAPVDEVHATYAGESLLEAAIDVAEQGRTHFRIDGLTLNYRSDFEKIDLIASNDGGGGLRISSLDEEFDGGEVATVVIPYGGETAGERLTLEHSSNDAPAGQTIDRANNTVSSNGGLVRIGPIQKVEVWEDIVAQADTDAAREAAANQLLHVAGSWLARRDVELEHYRVTIEDPPALLRPLQSVRVRYRGRGLVVDRDLFILGVSHQIGEERWTSQLELSSVDLRQLNSLDVLIEQIKLVRRLTRNTTT